MVEKITILTRRVSITAFLKKSLRNLLRFLRTFLKSGIIDFDIFVYYGHTAVTKSLVDGLKETDATFNINPFFSKDVGDTVVVLSDSSALQQAIGWKKVGKIKSLLAGPNILELPTKYNDSLSAPEIDLVLVPSDMVLKIYERLNPSLVGRIVSWYAGVDEKYWSPSNTPKSKEVLVYWKNAQKAFCVEVEKIIKNKGYKINRLVYGKYTKSQFKKILNRSLFSVFLSITETQGLALAESWSMNIPTLVWDPEIEHYYLRGIKTTSSPYLIPYENGIKWKELDEFEILLDSLNLKALTPRKWVLDNMTNKKSAELLIKICKSIKN